MSGRHRQPIGVLFVVVLAGAVVTGTGAFTAITADRAAAIDTVGDAESYLGMAPHNGPNGAYAHLDADGLIRLSLTGDNPNIDSGIAGGTGVPAEAVTHVAEVFNLSNHGTQSVAIWITEPSEAVTFDTTTDDHGSISSEEQALTLAPGETMAVGLVIDTRGTAGEERLLDSATIHAVAVGAETPITGPTPFSATQTTQTTLDGQAHVFDFSGLPTDPVENVTLTVTVNGDYDSSLESATVSVEGAIVGSVAAGSSGATCANVTASFDVPASTVSDGDLSVRVENTGDVSATPGCTPFVETTVTYDAAGS